MKAKVIDKNSPDNLSERDQLIYERWLKDRWSIDYRTEYCPTDHWQVVKKEIAVYSGGECRICGTNRVPMYVHHNPKRYKNLWQERYADVVYVCKDHHEIFHLGFPESECRVESYLSKMIYHDIKFHFKSLNFFEKKEIFACFYESRFSEIFEDNIDDIAKGDMLKYANMATAPEFSKSDRELAHRRLLLIAHWVLEKSLGFENERIDMVKNMYNALVNTYGVEVAEYAISNYLGK